LPEILKRLNDIELEILLRQVSEEAERRGVIKLGQVKAAPRAQKPQERLAKQIRNRDALGSLPTGKANLIRASHQAGMKPAVIARSFRLSQAIVDRVLDHPAKPRK
jgi:hypothetical protein